MSYVVGTVIFTILLGSILSIVFKREKELISCLETRKADLRVVEKLAQYAKLHNGGKNIDEVMNNLRTLNIEYNPQNNI
jgi:hypothetical protein